MPIKSYTCEEYNAVLDESDELARKLRHGKIKLVCSACGCDLEEQKHVDDRKRRLKRQMICINSDVDDAGNPACGKIFYRNEP